MAHTPRSIRTGMAGDRRDVDGRAAPSGHDGVLACIIEYCDPVVPYPGDRIPSFSMCALEFFVAGGCDLPPVEEIHGAHSFGCCSSQSSLSHSSV
jgi:hypothetical protein